MLMRPHRRTFLASLFAGASMPLLGRTASAAAAMIVHHDPGCGCCRQWVAHIRAAGFDATIVDEADMDAVKQRLRVPDALASCHTAEIGGYVIEGHVPASAVARLLKERPTAIGLSAPGMPEGSPGMETGAPPKAFQVVLFGPSGVTLYGRYRGAERV
jgi:hypothetical protein